MSRTLRLIAAMLGILAAPAFAQAPAPATPAPATPAPAAPSTTTAPRAAAAPRKAPAAADAKRIDINSATEKQLDALPGIGQVRGKGIVAGRPYAELTDLVSKKVLTQGVFDKLKDRIALANINTSTAAEMEKTLKGIGDVRSKAIVAGRPYATPQDLVTKGVLPQGVFNGMKDLITY